jgi:hypothetical protein
VAATPLYADETQIFQSYPQMTQMKNVCVKKSVLIGAIGGQKVFEPRFGGAAEFSWERRGNSKPVTAKPKKHSRL